MLLVRDAVRRVFKTQLEDAPEGEIVEARTFLNRVYDSFVYRHGPLSSRENIRAFAGDPDHPLLLSLEIYNAETKRALKAPIFERRTLERYRPVQHVETAAEALAISLNETGDIHWPRMTALTGRSEKQLERELGDMVYRNPSSGRWTMNPIAKLFNTNKGPCDSSLGSMISARDPWDLSFPLFSWSDRDSFTLRNAVESVAILGELGSAKTTGSAAWLLLKYLQIGMGGLVCCVKPGDRELIEAYAKETNRNDSLIIVSPAAKWRCNLIRYALKHPGAVGSRVEQIVSLLMTIVEAAERGERAGAGQGDKFWQRSLRQILRNGLEVCIAARGEVTMQMLHDVITTAPRTHAEVHSESWQKDSLCYQLIEEAEAKEKSSREQADFELAAKYFLREFPDMPNDTRAPFSPLTASWRTCCCADTWRTCSTAKRTSSPT